MAKTKPGRTDVDSYTIRGTNKVVRPGDCVLLRPADSDNAPCVARVEKLEADYRNNVKVHVRRYYRPEESIEGRRQFHGSKELFLSDHFDVQSAHTIEGKCIVHTFKSYTKLESVGAEDYFCRFEYKAAAGEFTPDSVAEYCKSEMPYNPDDLMVQCEDCKDWRKECSSCHSEITDRFRIQCAECSDFLLCSECYIRGAECSFCRRGRLSCPGICSDWDSDAERLLLEGLERYGPKKWEQVAHHVKTKTKEQCLDHFSDIYLSSPFYPRVCRNCYKRIAAIILWTKLLRTTGKAHDDTRNALTAAELSYAIQMWDAVVKVEEKSLERAVSRCKIEDAKESTKGRVEGEAKARSRPTYG